jgi:hypothetical protein
MHGETDGIQERDRGMQFKITFRNQFKALEFTLFLFLFTVGCMLYFYYSDPFFRLQIFVWLFIIQLVPVLYLHFEYSLINRGSSLVVNNDLSFFKYIKNHEAIDLNFNQIARIVLYLPPSAYRGSIERKMQFLPIEPYGYAVIYSKEGDKIIITSLMMPDVYKELEKIKGVPIDKKKRLFASPSFERIIQWFKKDGL